MTNLDLPTRAETDAAEGIISDGLSPLIPEGEYLAEFTGHDTSRTFGTPKLYLHFRIITPGNHFGCKLYRAFTVQALLGKPGRSGRFKVGLRSDLTLLVATLTASKMRPDRISFGCLRHKCIRIRVRTVKRNYRQKDLPESLRYSVVDDILGIQDP